MSTAVGISTISNKNLRLSLKDEAVGEDHGARAVMRSNSWAHPSLAGPRWLKFLMANGEMSPAVLANPTAAFGGVRH